MCTKAECERFIGKPVRFQTPYGWHVGVIERVTGTTAIVLSPRKYIPPNLLVADVADDEARLDIALAWWGAGRPGPYGPWGAPAGGYLGPGGGYPGYWGFGWGRWAVSFLIIYALLGLLWW